MLLLLDTTACHMRNVCAGDSGESVIKKRPEKDTR